MINLVDAEGTLIEKAAQLVRICWPRKDIFDHAKDKIIIYCRTRDEVRELQEILKCPAFTSESGSEQEKAAIITAWLSDPNQPVIVATSALSIGFDYPHVRWVIHLGAPSKMSSFSQESGRAGRDGQFATSLVILHSTWKPWTDGSLCPDKEAMQLYLARLHCYRGILSQFLDAESDWRWCMANEEPCQMCRGQGRTDARPAGLKFSLPSLAKEEVFTGPAEVLRQDHLQDQALDRYEQDFRLMVGNCLYCRAMSRRFDHAPMSCSRRFDWIHAKNEVCQAQKRAGKAWIAKYVACWHCYQPQHICRVADPEHEEAECQLPDMVIPLCYGVYRRPGSQEWFQKHFNRRFKALVDYMLWLGETASLGGNKCIQANCVAAVAFAEFG
jgi:hypothetical protein